MSETLAKVQKMVLAGEVEVSQHGLLELGADGIMLEDVVGGIEDAEVVEDYPDAHRGHRCSSCNSTAGAAPLTLPGDIPKPVQTRQF